MLEKRKIYSFKLTSGEELIARVLSEPNSDAHGKGEAIISQPVSVTPTERGMALVPSMFTVKADGEFTLNMNTISIYSEADEQIQAKYIEATTGIKVPDKKLILG
jgi:hypothetical protein